MNKSTKKSITIRNKTTTSELTINGYEVHDWDIGIIGVIDLKEYNLLDKINCSYNKITQIVNICSTVKYLNCKNNLISKFEYLPDGLKTLICDDNKIFNLDNLPSGLEFLSCENNKIVRLDNLPFGLNYLACGFNPITNLDCLPSGITKLFADGIPELKSLDDLPNSIEYMLCPTHIENKSKKNFPKKLVLKNASIGIWIKINT